MPHKYLESAGKCLLHINASGGMGHNPILNMIGYKGRPTLETSTQVYADSCLPRWPNTDHRKKHYSQSPQKT